MKSAGKLQRGSYFKSSVPFSAKFCNLYTTILAHSNSHKNPYDKLLSLNQRQPRPNLSPQDELQTKMIKNS